MNPSDDASAARLVEQALAASAAGDLERALELYAEALRVAPGRALTHFALGAELVEAGRVDQAESAFAQTVILAPQLVVARFQLGLLQYLSGRVPVALMTWQPLVDGAPESALARYANGFALLAAQDPVAARAAFEAGLQRRSGNPPLDRDIVGVIAKIDAALAAASAGGDGAPARFVEPEPEASTASDGEGDQHVLLSNYQRQGRPH